MSTKIYYFLTLIITVLGEKCLNPDIKSKTYTTDDATILKHIAYINEFEVKCEAGGAGRLYALMGDSILPIASVGPHKYQLSWTEDVKTAKVGLITVDVYDEAGYMQVKRALRIGEDFKAVRPFARIEIRHHGVYQGPMISCEVVASVLSIVIAYYALSFKSKLVS